MPPSDQLLVNFFTAEDFVGLLSRRAMLPLIVFSVLLGFAANLAGGPDGPVARGLTAVTQVMMQLIRLLTYYAPVAFFAIFAGLVADYGPKIAGAYGRAMAVYYPLCFVYLFTAFPLMARLGGGRGGVGIMLRHIARPALTSLGTCSSVATIPANLEAAEDTGISRDVAEMVIPLGATMHMDGSCFSCVLKIAFVWGVFGQELTWGKLLPIVAGGGAVLRGDVRRPRRRLHRGVHHLLHLLPPADGDGLPHSGGRRQSGGPARHHDQLLRGLCGLVSGVSLRGRQRLAHPPSKGIAKAPSRHRRVSVKQLILRMA